MRVCVCDLLFILATKVWPLPASSRWQLLVEKHLSLPPPTLCLTPATLAFYYILCALVCVSARTRVCLSLCVCCHCCCCCCATLSVGKCSGAHKQMIFNLLYLYVARISHCFRTFPHPKYFRTLWMQEDTPFDPFLASCTLCCCARDKAGRGRGRRQRESWLSLRAQCAHLAA